MSKIVRALLLSAVATGAAALVVTQLQRKQLSGSPKNHKQNGIIDADALSEEERNRLTNELGNML